MFKSLEHACTAGVTALALAFALAPVAHAQDSNVADPTTPPPPALPEPKADMARAFQPLAEDGITLALSYTGEAAAM